MKLQTQLGILGGGQLSQMLIQKATYRLQKKIPPIAFQV
jgi:phosphoribosylaminoimidazole carboxylase (NCAIR synthetase)